MHIYVPNYYSKFSCIGSRCQDNCCIGWEIDIDQDTCRRYLQEQGAFGERLRSHIDTRDIPHFILGEHERCPFLNADNLCDIHITLGEDALCRICTMHPRFVDQFGERGEIGLGLACEEAARCILCADQPFAVVLSETDAPAFYAESEPNDPALIEDFLAARDQLFTLLQDTQLSLEVRLVSILLYGSALQAAYEQDTDNFHDLCHQPQNPAAMARPLIHHDPQHSLDALRTLFADLDYMDTPWKSAVDTALSRSVAALQQAGPRIQSFLSPTLLSNFAVYLLFRYFLKAMRDGDILGKIQLAVVGVVLLYALIAANDRPDLPCILRQAQLFSKEIEYSEDNISALADAFIEDPALDILPLCSLCEVAINL